MNLRIFAASPLSPKDHPKSVSKRFSPLYSGGTQHVTLESVGYFYIICRAGQAALPTLFCGASDRRRLYAHLRIDIQHANEGHSGLPKDGSSRTPHSVASCTRAHTKDWRENGLNSAATPTRVVNPVLVGILLQRLVPWTVAYSRVRRLTEHSDPWLHCLLLLLGKPKARSSLTKFYITSPFRPTSRTQLITDQPSSRLDGICGCCGQRQCFYK